MKCEIRLAAADDISQALEFYASRERRLAIDFIAEIDHLLRLLERYPQLGREVAAGYRRFPLHHFPYVLHYRINPPRQAIEVVAVAHQHRRPGFWRTHIEEPAARYLLLGRAACHARREMEAGKGVRPRFLAKGV